jgi:hypothetical protein
MIKFIDKFYLLISQNHISVTVLGTELSALLRQARSLAIAVSNPIQGFDVLRRYKP